MNLQINYEFTILIFSVPSSALKINKLSPFKDEKINKPI